jgi:hypothetical protein
MRVSFVEKVGLARTKSRDNHGCDCNGVILFNRNGLRKENFFSACRNQKRKGPQSAAMFSG